VLALARASTLGEPLQALFPNLGELLQSQQSEETVAIQQRPHSTDSDNFDIHVVHVKEYIIRNHNDEQVSSNGTVAWERNILHSAHYSQPALLA